MKSEKKWRKLARRTILITASAILPCAMVGCMDEDDGQGGVSNGSAPPIEDPIYVTVENADFWGAIHIAHYHTRINERWETWIGKGQTHRFACEPGDRFEDIEFYHGDTGPDFEVVRSMQLIKVDSSARGISNDGNGVWTVGKY
ncbi:hypothetical protein [Pontiella desulfatans]|uniref:hypothetical protein n=1 Tax=Pontiella desulfatans TaxID=2750659 RepID=UPI00109D279B|nr:hypothetical protein [Pontiella desulfatans]